MEPHYQLYLIQDSDRPAYVIAESMRDAIVRWQMQIERENPLDDVNEPDGVQLAHDELIITPTAIYGGIDGEPIDAEYEPAPESGPDIGIPPADERPPTFEEEMCARRYEAKRRGDEEPF